VLLEDSLRTDSACLEEAVERQTVQRTGGRLRQFRVEITNEGVTVRGHAPSYYIKQLALVAVLDVLASIAWTPAVTLDIQVGAREVIATAEHE
jgi:hypothetical protein